MNSLKIGALSLVFSFSTIVLAADNSNQNTEKDRRMNDTHDCIKLTGTDKALCDQEMHNNNTNSKANDSSSINRDRNTNTRDDARSKSLNNKDSQAIDNQNRGQRPINKKANGAQPESTSPTKSTIDNSNNSSTNNLGVGTGTNNLSNINNRSDSSNGSKPK